MVKFYLLTNINNVEPLAIRDKTFIHVKAKTDGSQTAIISDEDVQGDGIVEMTKEQLHGVLDAWIAEENANPPNDPVTEEPIIQRPISLGLYVV